MDDNMTVIRSRKVVKSGLYCPCSLIKGPVPYGMQFYLKTESVDLPTEVKYLLIRIVKHSPTPIRVAVQFMERYIVGIEATVKSTLKAASNPGYPARGGDRSIHRLRENPQLEPFPEGISEEFLHGNVKIHYESETAYCVNATNTP